MSEMTGLFSPREAWDELSAERGWYVRKHRAAYSGVHEDLRATAVSGSFWARAGKAKVHVPIASDIASASADLLFGNPPRCRVYNDLTDEVEDGKQDRLDAILRESGFEGLLQEAAETAAVTGDVYLKCNWDAGALPCPTVAFVGGDDAVPEYRFGQLQCVHFFTDVKRERKTQKVWRLYERYERGRILSGIFCGDAADLGEEVPGALEAFGIDAETLVPGGGMMAVHIPNAKPSRVRKAEYGRSDFEGMRDMLDSLDEVYSSWMRDIRLAKSRLIVPAEFLRRKPNFGSEGESRYTFEFDEDVETLVALDISNDTEMKITPSQFAIRAEEHAKTAEALVRNIISMSGYSPQTFGLDIQGQASSGTALLIREKKSFSMRSKKLNYWSMPLERFLTAVMRLDAEVYGEISAQEGDRVIIEFPDSMSTDLSTISQAVQLMHNAQAASTETMVKMLHPDWEQGQIEDEVRKVMEEYGVATMEPDAMQGDLHGVPAGGEDEA